MGGGSSGGERAQPASAAGTLGSRLEERANCGYYLRTRHRLIRRHEESLSLHPDNTALWGLRVDFELPGHPEAFYRDGEEGMFLFPLVYLRKNKSRMQFQVFEERGGAVAIPIREECDDISARAITQAVEFLAAETYPGFGLLGEEREELARLIQKITSSNALESSMALQVMREQLGILPSADRTPSEAFRRLGTGIVSKGVDEALELLVEHVMLWVPLKGRPHERRSISLTQEVTLRRRSMIRWSFGAMTTPEHPSIHRRWARLAEGKGRNHRSVLLIGPNAYSRRDWRFSGSALGERIGQPLGWMPFEFNLPTIYAKRCGSYHFEVRCPPGRAPRDLRVSGGSLVDEPGGRQPSQSPIEGSRVTFSSRSARFDVPRGGLKDVTKFRVIVGIGNGAFPLLWFLAGAVTTVMLWILAGSNPGLNGEHAQTTAGILLIVPALMAGLAASTGEVPISQLIGGARILLLATGLSSVMAASVLAGARPFHLGPSTIWSLCAVAATVTTVPLATSWLLASPLIWRLMMRLNSYELQKLALAFGIALAALAIALLVCLSPTAWARIGIAAFFLLLMIVLSALANNRAAMPIEESRHYLGFSFLFAGFACLGLACIELRCVIYEHALASQAICLGPVEDLGTLRLAGESAALVLLALSFLSGDALSRVAKWASPRDDEVHVSPRELRALLAGESVRDLPVLFEQERKTKKREPVG